MAWQQTSRGRRSTPVTCITYCVPQSEPASGELAGIEGVVRWCGLRVHGYPLRSVRGGCVLVLIQRGKAAYPRSRGIPILACVDNTWHDKLSATFGCPAQAPWLSAAKPFTWGCWFRIGSFILFDFVLFCFVLFCFVFAAFSCRTPSKAMEITTVPRYFGAIRTPPRSGSR